MESPTAKASSGLQAHTALRPLGMSIGGGHAPPSQWLMPSPTAQTSLGPLPPTADTPKPPVSVVAVQCEPSQCSKPLPQPQISFFEVPHMRDGFPGESGDTGRFSNGRFFEVYPKKGKIPGPIDGGLLPTRN